MTKHTSRIDRHRRGLAAALLGALLAWTGTPDAADDEMVVIVHPESSVMSINKGDLERIFKGKTSSLGEERAKPVNLPLDSSLRKRFDRVVLDLEPNEVERYWIDQKIRDGKKPPHRVGSAEGVLRHVRANEGGIGYLQKSAVQGNVRVVAHIRGGDYQSP